jgi:hypothetical protein
VKREAIANEISPNRKSNRTAAIASLELPSGRLPDRIDQLRAQTILFDQINKDWFGVA